MSFRGGGRGGGGRDFGGRGGGRGGGFSAGGRGGRGGRGFVEEGPPAEICGKSTTITTLNTPLDLLDMLLFESLSIFTFIYYYL